MQKILVIGIGVGDPDYLTMEAVAALNRVEVFFVLDKGSAKEDLTRLRREICARFIVNHDYKFVDLIDPARNRNPRDTKEYKSVVADWHESRAELIEAACAAELSPNGVGAFLVWGDPSLYDSTLRIIEKILQRGRISFEYRVIPGITAIQALTARHRIPLNQVGDSVQITTGRRLAEAEHMPDHNIVVMLDAECMFTKLNPDLYIWWGAYLGTENEILMAGTIGEVGQQIVQIRSAARLQHGWIMDIYLVQAGE
ncbi:MAG: precorrin-6A synthase (deacetylating) [Mycobacteriaceae bacterium]